MQIKKYIPLELKNKIKEYLSSGNKYIQKYTKNDKKIILALAADYGNLGDVAITYAQRKFLKENFKNYKIIEVPIEKTYENMNSLKKIVNRKDIITIIGGGNFSDIYLDIEKTRQAFIKKFPNNKIVCFPQTIDFSESKKGEKEFKKAIRIYGNHKNLVLFAREKKSYNIMKNNFRKNKVFLAPDIVLSLNMQLPREKREYITLCFRDDKENKIDKNEKDKLKIKLKEKYKDKVIEKDTHVGNIKIVEEDREKYLNSIWSVFRKSKVVLTDRLHGMIFSVITGTPCIAFKNSNGKIQQTYETWLKDFPEIEMITGDFSIEDIEKKIQDKLEKESIINYNEKKVEYEDLVNEIEGE